MKINVKSVFDPPRPGDGYRILVDRFVPVGLRQKGARLDLWMRDIQPSDRLMKKYGHSPESWHEFECGYFRELDGKTELIDLIYNQARRGSVTLLYSSHDKEHNPAKAIKEYILVRRHKITKRAA